MKKILLFLFSIIILSACTLSATQEKKLNESLSVYVNARNECLVVSYVAFTYPEIVLNYKSQSDSIFKAAFDCNSDTLYLQDPTVRGTKKEKETIHVKYDLDVFNKNTGERQLEKHTLFAISEDNGSSWFFMNKKEYVDKTMLPNFKRLFFE